ncbi:MAG: TonB-dependent receptor, partial [Gammaproteobacteria bacterium]|nr:TonB-dependent receptor [Gammaproteobacteria bacterium]
TYHYPTWKSQTSFSWTKGDFYSELTANYTSSYEGIDPSTKVDSFLTFDLQFSYSGWDSGTATLGVKNLADKAPPFANEEPGYDFAIANPTGRFIYAQYTQKL